MPTPADIPRVPTAEIVIDGDISEAAWAQAAVFSGFKVYRPKPDTDPASDTVVRVLSDDQTLYISFQADDSEPDKIRAGMGRRDTRRGDDYVGLVLDPLGTGERGAVFIVNPLGIQMDGTHVRGQDQELIPWRGSFSAWDARWRSAGRPNQQGYAVEIAIPWRNLRHPANVDELGLLFFRHVSRSAERSAWPQLDSKATGVLPQLAALGGPGSLPEGSGLSLIPEFTYGLTPQGPEQGRLGLGGMSPGLTIQAAPTPGLQLLGTLNPDFSQVESDSAQIDINQRYSLKLKEKRPFFLEGQEWFTHPVRNLIYTRTMVTPLYGARTTAESGPWAVGAMHLWDRTPSASINEGGGWTESQLQGHDALQSVARARRSIGEDSMVGAIYSDRTILDTDLSHRLAGLDGRIPIGGGITAEGAALVSDTTGLDATTRSAPAAVMGLERRSKHTKFDTRMHYFSPGFRSENGYLPQSDRVGFDGELELLAFPSMPLIPRIFCSPIDLSTDWHQDGRLRELELRPKLGTWFSNGAMIMAMGEHTEELYEDTYLESNRGEVFMVSRWTGWLTSFTEFSTGQAPLYDPDEPAVGWADRGGVRLIVQPTPRLIFSPHVYWEQFDLSGEEVYSGWVGRLKLEAFATPSLWGRMIYDRSTFTDTHTWESLVALEKEPGKAIYLGGSLVQQGPEAEEPSTEAEWQIFTKLSWVFGS
jgi:hypothetical protein